MEVALECKWKVEYENVGRRPSSPVCDYRWEPVKTLLIILLVIITRRLTWLCFSSVGGLKLTEHQRNPPSDYLLKSSTFQWAHASWNNLILHTIQTCSAGMAQCSGGRTLKLFRFWHRASVWNRAVLLVPWSYIKSEVSGEDKTNCIMMVTK